MKRMLWLALAVACEEPAPPPPAQGSFEAGVVARVGGEVVFAATVARIAQAQGVALREARDRAVYDTLLAAGAREALTPPEIAGAARSVLGRALLSELWKEASAAPITARELELATAQRWTEFDRPRGFRVVHAVVRTAPNMPPAEVQRMRRLADRIREAVARVAASAGHTPAPDMDADRMFAFDKRLVDPLAESFIKAARGVHEPNIEVIAEELPPIAADRRVIEIDSPPDYRPLDPSFCDAATGLEPKRGALSEIVTSPYGFHVIMLLAVTPEKRVSEAERRRALRANILNVRGRRAQRELLESLRRELPVEVAANAVSRMAEVQLRKGADESPADPSPASGGLP